MRSFETEQDDGPRAPQRAAGVIDESAAERTRECVRCYCISQALKAVESNGMMKGTREVAEKYSIDRRLLTTQEDAAARELGEAAVDVHGLSRQAVSLLSSSGSTKRFCCIQLHSATPSLWCSIVIPTGPLTVSTLKVKFSFLELQAVHNTKSAAHVNIAHRLVIFGVWAAGLRALPEEFVAHEARTVEMKKQLYALRNRITSEVNAVASKELVQERETCLRWTLEQSPSPPYHLRCRLWISTSARVLVQTGTWGNRELGQRP